MLTEMQRQFGEVAARTMKEHHLLHATPPDHWIGKEDVWRQLESLPGLEQEYLLRAHYLLGRLEGENRATIEQIVSSLPDACSRCGDERTARGGDAHCGGDCDHFAHDQEGECHAYIPPDSAALFRAIALEALGQGSVRETFGEISLSGPVDAASVLNAIANMRPRAFDGMPDDWNEQVAACNECQGWAKNHPIQRGICDTHRQPLWARETHDAFEKSALGPRMAIIASNALRDGTRPLIIPRLAKGAPPTA